MVIVPLAAFVTGFSKWVLHNCTSSFSTLKLYNSTHVCSRALKFGSNASLSLHLHEGKFYCNSLLTNELTHIQYCIIRCMYKNESFLQIQSLPYIDESIRTHWPITKGRLQCKNRLLVWSSLHFWFSMGAHTNRAIVFPTHVVWVYKL